MPEKSTLSALGGNHLCLVAQLEEGQVTIEAKALHFPTGAQLLDYVEDIKAQLLRSEVEP